MKALILNLSLGIISLAFTQESTWKKSPIKTAWNSVFHQMTFRNPVVFTPLEIKAGYLYYGGKNYWSQSPFNSTSVTVTDLPVLLDSTQYEFNIIENASKRKGMFMEIDFLRTNLPHFIIHQNYIDFQLGMGMQIINFFSNPTLPREEGTEWIENSTTKTGNYYFNPRSIGINMNSSLSWQLSQRRLTYIYHSLGISSVSLYESEGGNRSLTGIGLNESFGIGVKYILKPEQTAYNYTIGVEIKWNRLYMSSVDAPDGLSPIEGIDIRSSGIFLTSGIQFGGRKTDGDIAYSKMIKNDYISASEYFKTFLEVEKRPSRRKKAVKMLQKCQTQIPYQKIKLGIESYLQSNIDETIKWFNSAELNADEDAMKTIQANRQRIASELLDSIKTHKNEMRMIHAEKIAESALELFPESKKYPQVMASLYIYKAQLNTEVGNFSGAIDNYKNAMNIYPEMEYFIIEKLHTIANSIMKEAYFSYQDNQIYMVLESMKDFIELQPHMAQELDNYILQLERKIDNLNDKNMNNNAQRFIMDKQYESLGLSESSIQLGMSEKIVKEVLGKPEHIDKHIEDGQEFKMWTYSKNSNFHHLYFRNERLIQIQK